MIENNNVTFSKCLLVEIKIEDIFQCCRRMFFNVSQAPSHNHSSTWNIDTGKYEPNQVPFPMHVIDAGLQFSLTVILKINSYEGDYLCGEPVPGFKIGFHSPFDFPSSRKNFYDLSPKQAVIYSIEPVFVSTSNDMRKFGPDERGCFFSSERKLRFYRIYTTTNCIRECLANFTLAKCDCVHFAMPREFNLHCSFDIIGYSILLVQIRIKWYENMRH